VKCDLKKYATLYVLNAPYYIMNINFMESKTKAAGTDLGQQGQWKTKGHFKGQKNFARLRRATSPSILILQNFEKSWYQWKKCTSLDETCDFYDFFE